jgi:hypothetical protein
MATPQQLVKSSELQLAPRSRRHPDQHFLIYGRSGAGKSRFLTTFPKPARIFMFDAHGKDTQYLRFGGKSYTELVDRDFSPKQDGGCIVPCRYILNAKGEIAMEILYFHDEEWVTGEQRYYTDGNWKVEKGVGVPRPTAYPRFLNVMATFTNEASARWGTIGLDSTTSFALAARRWGQYTMNPFSKEPRQWFAFATDRLEEMLNGRWLSLRSNVVLLCHIDQDKDELHSEMVYNPAAPGRLAKADGLPSQYGEFYRLHVLRDKESGSIERLLQTENDGRYNASSQIGAPDPSVPHYEALWANWT